MTDRERRNFLADPFGLKELCRPGRKFYSKQREVIRSVERNKESYVAAGNMLGKDYLAGYVCVRNAVVRRQFRIVTTSVKDDHLRVLWGEINDWIEGSRYPLKVEDGGPLAVRFRDVRKVVGPADRRVECSISYLRGMVSERGEGMAGHHAPWTLGVIDEASGVDDLVYTQMCTWAKRLLIFGNPNPCENFFRRGVDAGDLTMADMARMSMGQKAG